MAPADKFFAVLYTCITLYAVITVTNMFYKEQYGHPLLDVSGFISSLASHIADCKDAAVALCDDEKIRQYNAGYTQGKFDTITRFQHALNMTRTVRT